MTEPLLLDVPTEITTERLRLRVPREGDGAVIIPTVRASLAELKPWLPWATDGYGAADAEVWVRRAAGQFLLRQRFDYVLFAGQAHVGAIAMHDVRWDVPEVQIGYWLATSAVGQGYMTEAVTAVAAMATEVFGANRLVIRADAANGRSRRVAERCGFTLEGLLRHWRRDPTGRLSDECVYAIVR